jgi:hypothetical protein
VPGPWGPGFFVRAKAPPGGPVGVGVGRAGPEAMIASGGVEKEATTASGQPGFTDSARVAQPPNRQGLNCPTPLEPTGSTTFPVPAVPTAIRSLQRRSMRGDGWSMGQGGGAGD